jgi:hypothetical protein
MRCCATYDTLPSELAISLTVLAKYFLVRTTEDFDRGLAHASTNFASRGNLKSHCSVIVPALGIRGVCSITDFLHHHSHLAMPTVLSIVLTLSGLFLIRLLLGLRRAARDVK